MMLDCRNGGGNDIFEDVPLPFFLKISEGEEPFGDVLSLLFVAKLNFDFVLFDSDEFSRSRPELLPKGFFRQHDVLVQKECFSEFFCFGFFVIQNFYFDFFQYSFEPEESFLSKS